MAEMIRGLNLVLLGRTGIGKSASGNAILGREAFRSMKSSTSVTRDIAVESGTVCGRRVTVYDTPGLFHTDMSEDEIQKKYKEVLQRCESGPCVFLLVIKADRFTEEEREAVEKMEQLLGEERLKKTWILFTRGDDLEEENMTIEEYINLSHPLKKVVQKYDQRYHVFNNKTKKQAGQVQELFIKIFMPHLGELLETLKLNPLTRRIPQEIEPDAPADRRSSRRLDLLGKSGVGKSAARNTILGQREFISWRRMSSVTRDCSDAHTTVSGRSVTVVDTPGLFDRQMRLEEQRQREEEEREQQEEKQIQEEIEKRARAASSYRSVLRAARLSSRRLDLLGKSGVGKSAAGNTILGQRELISVQRMSSVTRDCSDAHTTVPGRSVTVVDTPGFFDTQMRPEEQRPREEEEREQQEEKQIQEEIEKRARAESSYRSVLRAARLSSRRLDLLGKSGVGKSAAGNTILGQRELISVQRMSSVTRDCSDAHTTVPGRSVTVVDTPGFFDTQMRPEEQRPREEEEREQQEEKQIQEEIEKRARAESSYRSVLRAARLSSRQLDLLGKSGVGKSAAGNTILGQREFISWRRMSSVTRDCSDAHTTVSGRSVSVVDTPGFFDTQMRPEEQRPREEEEREQQEEKQIQEEIEKRARAESSYRSVLRAARLSSRRLDLLGKSGVGKSAAGNTILGQRELISVQRMSSVTRDCSDAHTTVPGRSVTVVDTPGFFDTQMRLEEQRPREEEEREQQEEKQIQEEIEKRARAASSYRSVLRAAWLSSRRLDLLGKSGVGKSAAGNNPGTERAYICTENEFSNP